jgi:hypothetical protein
MLVLGQLDLHDLLADPRIDGDAVERGMGRLRAQDLEAPLVQRRGDRHRHRLDHPTLAGQAIAVADQRRAELELVHPPWPGAECPRRTSPGRRCSVRALRRSR